MDFDKFIRIIRTGVDSYTLYELPVELFLAANNSLFVTEEMAANWIKGNNQSYKKQFKEERNFKPFDDENFIKFLKSHTNKSWVNIQNSFKDEYNDNYVIDCSTTEHDVFLQSIMFQFKEIISYPYDKLTVPTKRDETGIIEKEKSPLNEAPSRQMTKEFERLISEYKIAYFICSQLTYSQRVDEFVETVKIELLAKFVNEQEDDTYKNISKFNETLYGFNISLEYLNPSNARQFHLYTSFLRTLDITLNDIHAQITEDRDRLIKIKENRFGEGIQSRHELEEDITQPTVIESLLNMYSQINTLYNTICNGKTLLVF